jgi:glutaredoxin
MRCFFLIASILVVAVSPAFDQQFYEYTDKDGNIVITESPPPGSESRKKRLKEDGVYYSTRGEKDYPSFEQKEPSTHAAGQEKPKKKDYNRVAVVMYMTDWCGYCKKAREYIRTLGAELIEYNIDKDNSRRDEMRQKSGGSTAVPLIDIEGTIIPGYSPEAIKAAIDRAAE